MIRKQTEPTKPRVQSKAGSSRTLPPIHSLTSTDDRTPSENSAGLVRSTTFVEETKRQQKQPQPQQQPDQESEPSSKQQKVERVKLPVYPNISNMAEFRKRHKLDPKTKVYVVTGGYGDIKRALDKRGWVQNPDPKSRCFDLKWTIKSNEEEIPYLEDSQMVNHFEGNATFTSKVGLCRNLRNLIHFSNVDIDAFYPKCFDLSDEKDYDDFIEDFKFTKAESIMKLYVRLCKEGEATLAKAMEETVLVAIGVCEKKTVDLDEVLEAHGEILPVKITDEEWKILSKDEITAESLIKKKFEARLMKLENGGKPKKVTKKKTKRKIIDAKALPSGKENLNKAKRNSGDEGSKEVSGENEEATEIEEVKNELLEKVELLLKKLKEKNPQNGLIGDKNIWMLKPAGLSRGRGITCVKDLAEVMDVARKNANHWVVQKYIENPLIIHKRKFDIRQWVLVTDWNPLTIWFFEECYVRFSGDEYNPDDLENRYVHLTNNSVVKHMKEGNKDDDLFEGNMWRMETFQGHMQERFGSDVFNEVIKPKMKQAVIWSLESVQDMIGNRKSSFELYGYDFMVDEDLNVWLIEINLSPSLDYSTPVTKRLVKMVSEDTVKVVVDYGMSKKKKKSDIDTGLFTRIHKSKRCVEKPMNSYGLDLVCEGTVIEKPEKSS